MEKRLFALRGAACCENTAAYIETQVTALYDALLAANDLTEADIVSIIFSVTGDLDAKNPCAALRHSGRAQDTALFAVAEAFTVGSLPRTVRALIHCYMEEGREAKHLYRNGAEVLRPDRRFAGAPLSC